MQTRDLAKLKTWTSVEINGLICIWYHADDEPPVWVPLPLPQVNSGAWVYQGRNEYHVTCHIQDIPENGADPAHLDAVHASAIIGGGEPSRWMEWLTQWTWHEWAIDWRPLEEAEGDNLKHRAKVNLSHTMTMMGRFNLFSLKVHKLCICDY
jgi:cholesterol 7-dehydrogenase